jgi:hypothetical protein
MTGAKRSPFRTLIRGNSDIAANLVETSLVLSIDEARAEQAFKEIARLTRGAYCHFSRLH